MVSVSKFWLLGRCWCLNTLYRPSTRRKIEIKINHTWQLYSYRLLLWRFIDVFVYTVYLFIYLSVGGKWGLVMCVVLTSGWWEKYFFLVWLFECKVSFGTEAGLSLLISFPSFRSPSVCFCCLDWWSLASALFSACLCYFIGFWGFFPPFFFIHCCAFRFFC